jgi:DNA-binding response OmpR family regulator
MSDAQSNLFHSGFKVAVVDDDPSIRLSTTRLLSKEGYTVLEAANGADGEALIREKTPDLVLMDVHLGDTDGRDLCKSLRGDPALKTTCFVLISNIATTPDDQVRGLDEGADGYITRPIENRELLARVNAYRRIVEAKQEQQKALQALQKSEEKNKKHIIELEYFNKLAVDREMRMIELKKEINKLCNELGRENRYEG